MNRKPDKEQLLDDVLTEATPTRFRDTLLSETLCLVKRRRRWRETRRAAALLALLALFGFFIRQDNLPQKSTAPAPAAATKRKSLMLVNTQTLPTGNVVARQPRISNQLVATAETVKVVQTQSGGYCMVSDEELLALVASHPAVLIRTKEHSEKLVFVNPKDEKGFPLK